MSAWAEVDALKRDYFKTARGVTRRRMERSADSTWHARIEAKCYRYTLVSGEVREWQQHQLAHAHDWRRVGVVGACAVVNGVLPALVGEHANRLTQDFRRINCDQCRIVLDRLIESGEWFVDVVGRNLTLKRRVDTPKPLYMRCALCGGNRETCGHFVGSGAL